MLRILQLDNFNIVDIVRFYEKTISDLLLYFKWVDMAATLKCNYIFGIGYIPNMESLYTILILTHSISGLLVGGWNHGYTMSTKVRAVNGPKSCLNLPNTKSNNSQCPISPEGRTDPDLGSVSLNVIGQDSGFGSRPLGF